MLTCTKIDDTVSTRPQSLQHGSEFEPIHFHTIIFPATMVTCHYFTSFARHRKLSNRQFEPIPVQMDRQKIIQFRGKEFSHEHQSFKPVLRLLLIASSVLVLAQQMGYIDQLSPRTAMLASACCGGFCTVSASAWS